MSAHSQKTFHVIDMPRARQLLTEAAGQSSPGFHEGRFFARIETEVVVATVADCVSAPQARLLAANGGDWETFRVRKAAGTMRRRTYLDTARYACVETVVLDAMRTMAEIDWDADRVRTRVYQEAGDAVCTRLCMHFRPPSVNDATSLRVIAFIPAVPSDQLVLFPGMDLPSRQSRPFWDKRRKRRPAGQRLLPFHRRPAP